MWNTDTSCDAIEVKIITPIYKNKTVTKIIEGEKTKIVKSILVKEIHMKKWLRKDGITSVDQYMTANQTIAKNRSVIYDKYTSKYFAIGESAESIMERLKPNKSKIGFQ